MMVRVAGLLLVLVGLSLQYNTYYGYTNQELEAFINNTVSKHDNTSLYTKLQFTTIYFTTQVTLPYPTLHYTAGGGDGG